MKPVALILVFLFGLAQALQTASIEGVVVKTGIADVTIRFPGLHNGKTVAAGVGEPLAGVTVELTAVDGGRVRWYTTRTGRDGKFQFRNLPAGAGYQLVAILSPDYLPGQYGQPSAGLPGIPISLSSGQQMKDLRIALTPAGTISGRALSPGLSRVRSWRVSLVRPFYVDGQRVLGSLPFGKSGVVATTSTNNRGEYEFRGLPPGQYYVVDALGNYYAGPASMEPAPIHLRPGENLKGLDISIGLTSRSLSGRIVDVNRHAVESAEIAILRRDAIASAVSPSFRKTGASFTATTTAAGAHLLLVRAIENGLPLFGYAPVGAGASDVSNIQIVVAPPSDISGLVIGGPPGARLSVSLRPLLPGMANSPVIGVSPGFIAVGVGAGDYRVDVAGSPPGEAYIKSIRFDSIESTDGVIRLNGQSNGRIEIVMGTNGGVLSGQVVNERREPVMNARAILAPKRRGRFDLYKAVLADEQGRFEMPGIAPGDYTVFVWELVQEDAWRDPRFLAFYEDLGKPVRIEEGRRNSLDVTPIPPWR